MPVSTTPIVSPPGEHTNDLDHGGSSHIITVMTGPSIAIRNSTFSTTLPGPGDSQVRHLCRPKAFRQLSNSTSLIDEIFNHPDASETLLREKIKKANDLDTSRDLLDYLRNKTPPPENYMSYEEQVKGGEPPTKNKKKRVLSSLLRKLRIPKKDGKTSSAPAPLFQLPDSAVSGRTIGGHRHIAISIPLEHANIDGIVDGTEPPAEALPEEESPAEPVPEESLSEEPVPADPVPAEPPQPDIKEGPIIIRRKPLINGTPPVVGARSSSTGAPTGTARIISRSPPKAPSPILDPDETLVVPPISSPEPAAAQRCGNSKGGAGSLPEVVGGRSLAGCPHRELTAPRVTVAGVVVPLRGVFSPPPPRPLHRSPPLRHLYAISHSGSKETVPEIATSSTATYHSEAESTASSAGATVGASVIPEIKGQQNTAPNTQPIGIPAQKKSFRDWCGTVQLPSPPAEPEDPLSSPDPDRFVTAQTSPDPETDNSSPWATPFEESTFIDYPPCGCSTPKPRPLPSPPPAAPPTPKDNKVSKHRQRRRRIPRSESHVQLMAKYQRLQMLRARELELLLGRVAGRSSEVAARRGHVNVHALEPGHYTTAPAADGRGMAVLYERDDGFDDYEEVSSAAFGEMSSGGEETTVLPENLASDYEETESNPSSDGYTPSLEAGSETITSYQHHTTTPRHTRDHDHLPSRRHRRYGFAPASHTASSPRLPIPVESDDSFETFLERMDAATRDALAARETRRWSVDCDRGREDEYDGLGGGGWGQGGDGLETVEAVMKWLIETSCGGEVSGLGE